MTWPTGKVETRTGRDSCLSVPIMRGSMRLLNTSGRKGRNHVSGGYKYDLVHFPNVLRKDRGAEVIPPRLQVEN